jgi:hypothetical protein
MIRQFFGYVFKWRLTMRTKIFSLIGLMIILGTVFSGAEGRTFSRDKTGDLVKNQSGRIAQMLREDTTQELASLISSDNQNIDFVRQIGGAISDIFVKGNYLYTSSGPRLQVVDISNPASPQLVGQSALLPDVFSHIYVSGGYVYLALGEHGLQIFDVNTPANPVLIGAYDTPRVPLDLFVSGNYAYIPDGEWDESCGYCYQAEVLIVNVNDPANPFLAGIFDAETPESLFVVGELAYIADTSVGLRVLDVSNPNSPIEVGTFPAPPNSFFYDVQAIGNTAYVLGRDGYLRIIDVTDVANPVEAGSYFFGASPDVGLGDMVYQDGYLFVAELDVYAQKLWILNVNDPANPMPVGSFTTPRGPREVFVLGDYVYTADVLENRLYILNINEIENPSLAGVYDSMFFLTFGVVFQENYAFVGGTYRFYVLNITDPVNPVVSNIHETPGYRARVIHVNENYLFVNVEFISPPSGCSIICSSFGEAENGLRIYDVSDPTNLVEVGFLPYTGIIVGNYLYKGESDGVRIVDITDPTNPIELGAYSPISVRFVSGNYAYGYAYLPDDNYALVILDMSDPTDPVEVGKYVLDLEWKNIFVIGNYAYLADEYYENGLMILDISDPSNPVEVGSYTECPHTNLVSGKYVFSVGTMFSSDICILDFSDPLHPVQVGSFSNTFQGHVYYNDGYIYFATPGAGLWILRFYWPVMDRFYLPLITR